MDKFIKWTLTRWRHYKLLRSLVGTVVNGIKLRLIQQYMFIQYMWAINLVGENIINHTALLHSTAWKQGGVQGPLSVPCNHHIRNPLYEQMIISPSDVIETNELYTIHCCRPDSNIDEYLLDHSLWLEPGLLTNACQRI